jgi:translation initiation factor 1
MKALAKQLKKAVGAGGAVKGDTIEVQGGNRDAVAAKLQKLGHKTKFVGG